MDWKKKYEEITKRVKELHESGNALTKSQMEIICPEIFESEDERIRKALVKTFEKRLEIGFEWTEFGIPNRSVLDWLEKQKEQKPAEWSEEDEEMLDIVLTMVDCSTVVPHSGGQLHPSENYKKDISTWLKSLRPQPHWKPSEEQMAALSWAINYLSDIEQEYAFTLALLKFDLKKRM